MINQFKAVQSCLSVLNGYATANNYRIAIDGKKFTPDVDDVYFQEFFIANDNEQGLSNDCVQVQLPIYQINIHTPKKFGKWKALEVYGELVALFERGSDISNDVGQQVRIEQVNNRVIEPTDTHNVLAVSVDLRVLG